MKRILTVLLLFCLSCNYLLAGEDKKYKGWFSRSLQLALEKGVNVDFMGIYIRKSKGDKNYALCVNAIKPRNEDRFVSKKELLNILDQIIKDDESSELGILIDADPNVTVKELTDILVELQKRQFKNILIFNVEGVFVEIHSDMKSEKLEIPKPPEVENTKEKNIHNEEYVLNPPSSGK